MFNRSPAADVARAISKYTTGKVFYEIGPAEGDVLIEVGKDALEVGGIEQTTESAAISNKRLQAAGLTGAVANAKFRAGGPLQQADVYYVYADLALFVEFYKMVTEQDLKAVFIFGDITEGLDFMQAAMIAHGMEMIPVAGGTFNIFVLDRRQTE